MLASSTMFSVARNVVAAVLILGCTSAGAENAFEFELGSDPSKAVLSIEKGGASMAGRLRFDLFGDGNCLLQKVGPGGVALEKRTAQLSYQDMRAVVARLLAAGVMEFDRDEITNRIRAEHGGLPGSSDVGPIFVSLRLDSYTRAGVASGEPRERDIRAGGGLLKMSSRGPAQIEEVSAVADLYRWAQELWREADPAQ